MATEALLPIVAGTLPPGVLVCEVRSHGGKEAPALPSSKGRGAFALRSFAAGDVVMKELPFVAMQDVPNRHRAWTCGHCFTFLQSLEGQFRWHQKQIQTILGGQERAVASTPEEEEVVGGERFLQTEVVECWHACGELYCSERCRNEAFAEHHEVLCVGRVDSVQHPLVVFKEHAIAHNDLFLLAAQTVVRIFNNIRSSSTELDGSLDLGYAQRFLDSFCHRSWLEIMKSVWHDANSEGEGDNGDGEALKALSDESYYSLRLALFSPPSPFAAPALSAKLQDLFTPDFYLHLLGLLEMNQNAIHIVSPLQTYATLLHERLFPSDTTLPPETAAGFPNVSFDPCTISATWQRLMNASKRLRQAEIVLKEDENDNDEDEEADRSHGHKSDERHDCKGKSKIETNGGEEEASEHDNRSDIHMFPPFEGFGLFPLAAMMNHSCAPNTQVVFKRNRKAIVVALRGIAEGEELTHSYIENEQSLADRQASLLEYNFICQCSRCQDEGC